MNDSFRIFDHYQLNPKLRNRENYGPPMTFVKVFIKYQLL
jgi:hypothetical protein